MKDRREVLTGLALLVGVGALEALLLRIAGPPSSHLRVLADLANPMAEPLEGTLAAFALSAEALTRFSAAPSSHSSRSRRYRRGQGSAPRNRCRPRWPRRTPPRSRARG